MDYKQTCWLMLAVTLLSRFVFMSSMLCWFRCDYCNWAEDYPEYAQSHINTLELLTVLLSIKRWGSCLQGTHFIVRTDNMTALATFNKGTSRSREIMPIVREIFLLSVKFDFTLRAVFLPGVDNVLADRISRMNVLSSACEVSHVLSGVHNVVLSYESNMSKAAFLSLQAQWTAALLNCS